MKKVLLTLILISAFAVYSFAQSDDAGKLSIGINPGLAVGTFNQVSTYTIGGDLKYSQPVGGGFQVSLSGGYDVFIGKTITIDGFSGKIGDLKAIPVKAGVRYYADGSKGFFGEAQFGASFVQQGGGTAFLYAPGIGYMLDGGFEAGVRYEGWAKDGGTIGQVALRLAYSF